MARFSFPPKFINIVKTLYSEVLVNGFRTPPFSIQRGVLQSDPLSLFLFLIATEPFMVAVRNNNNILGIQTPGRFRLKALSYADDVTVTVVSETCKHLRTSIQNKTKKQPNHRTMHDKPPRHYNPH